MSGTNRDDGDGVRRGTAGDGPQKRPGASRGRRTASSDTTNQLHVPVNVPADESAPSVVAMLRAVATNIERDPILAQAVGQMLRQPRETASTDDGLPGSHTEHVLVPAVPNEPAGKSAKPRAATRSSRASSADQDAATRASGPAVDPFAALREQGEIGLLQQLGSLDLTALRAVIRAHRLDPARISARWTSCERLVELIVEQVRARARLGRAFERV